MYDFIIKSPSDGRIVVVASRQRCKYAQKGYITIGRLDMSNEDVKYLIQKGHTKEEVVAMGVGNKIKLIKKVKNGKEYFYAV